MKRLCSYSIIFVLVLATITFLYFSCSSPEGYKVRQQISLNSGWKTIASDTNPHAFDGFEKTGFDDSQLKSVDVPHNWDHYHGYLRKLHGNRHGTAWYRKSFQLDKTDKNKCVFLFFEGVGSYATVWVNGIKVGFHAGGRTTFTLDITHAVLNDTLNLLAVRADHPASIRDLPWVCGGCSNEWGFSEGSQPMGIFRPVTLIITNDVRVEPYGVHIWNDTDITEKKAHVNICTEIKNYSDKTRSLTLINRLLDQSGNKVTETAIEFVLDPGVTKIIKDNNVEVINPVLWSPENPCLYTLQSMILENKEVIDKTETPYGIRWISWPVNRSDSTGQFLLNGKSLFINGIGEYEHMFGNSHAFTDEQIKARCEQVMASGFNAFRDAHQPHNLRYQQYWDREGLLWWPQMSAHIWFDNQAFRENFKALLRDWVKERRNSPSNIMWGLQNESVLPEEFARECVEIIRELDPTSFSQRIITTCNGGSGTDWDVMQNWSGTYGGDPYSYDKELKLQLLNGEYGAWRSIDLHSEGPFDQQGILSEERMTQLLQMKIRQAESVRDQCCGQFLWLFSSHDNPGRIQSGEGLRESDRIGPVNHKGLFTPWGEPLDVFYMYRAHYVDKEKEPMVYIVSHTWPNRWINAGIKDSITIYSNCDEVELYNDINASSLGKKKNKGRRISFLWERAEIRYNVLQAVGYVNGKAVAHDMIVLNHLPEAPGLKKLIEEYQSTTKPRSGYQYIYRVNCGGPDYTDKNGNKWKADRPQVSEDTWGSRSWSDSFKGVPSLYGSQRRTFDMIDGTNDQVLFRSFRYGLNQLSFNFPVPEGEYLVELYFTEPWYGTGGGMDCKGWRLFDVAVNDNTLLKNFDIWDECGHDRAIKKEFKVKVTDDVLRIHFPRVISGQAIISAIAIAGKNKNTLPAQASSLNIRDFIQAPEPQKWQVETWLDIGDLQFTDKNIRFCDLPSLLFGAEWIKTPYLIKNTGDMTASFITGKRSDVFIAIPSQISSVPEWMKSYTIAPITLKSDDGNVYNIYSMRVPKESMIRLGDLHVEGREAGSYSIFVVPVSSLAASVDQRPLQEYSSDLAIIKGTACKKQVQNGRHFLAFTGNSETSIEWKISVGLASTYGIHFKFQNSTGKPVSAEMIIVSSGGIEMHRGTVNFKHEEEKWQTFRTFTGTSINAGDYRVRLIISNAKGLLLQRMEVR